MKLEGFLGSKGCLELEGITAFSDPTSARVAPWVCYLVILGLCAQGTKLQDNFSNQRPK